MTYVKVADDGLVYYLEQITDKYGNENLLVNKQMIKTGINDIPDASGIREAIRKKQTDNEFLADLKARQVYAQSVHQNQSVSNNSITNEVAKSDDVNNSNVDAQIVKEYNESSGSINSSYYFDNRASEKKESSINWVYKAKIFSQVENKLFHQKISEINQGSQAFTKNLAGEYMLPIENKIVFTDGNYDSPYISEIIEVLTEYQTEFNKIKERIFNVERGESEKQDEVQIVRQMFGKGRVLSYNSEADGVYDWENGRRKGSTRRAVISNYLRKQERGENDTKGKAAEVNKTDSSNKNATADNVEASKQFNNDIGADFTESALLMPQNESADTDNSSDESILTEPTVKKADSDPVRDYAFELSGREYYTYEQLKVVSVARKFGRKVIFEDTTKTQGFKSDGYYDSEGNIHLDYDNVKPLEWILKHELTHFGEGTDAYNEYVEVLRKTKAYKEWLQKELRTDEESLGKLEGLMRDKIMAEREAVAPINPVEAQAEIIANFSATFAFAKDSRGIEALTADMSLKEHNAFVQFLIDFISYLKKKLGGSNKTLTRELSVLEDRYLKMLAYKAQNPTTDKDSGNKYSIVALENGNLYVSASRKIIAGNDISDWRSQITDFFKTLLDNNESLEIQTVEGDTLTITMSETAHKARDNYKQVAGKPVRMTDSEFKVKLNVETHIDEITEISKENKNSATPDSKNHGFAKDGFTYRTAYFEDFDGQYYKITLSIGENNNVATVYNVGKIKKEALPSAKIIAVVGSKALGNTSNNNVSQSEPVVNNNSMQEAAKNSQENISEEKNNGNKYSLSVENENEGLYNDEEDNSISEDAVSDRINNNFYQEFLNDMPIDEYNKLTVKKPIRVTKDIFAAVNSARTQLYGDAATEDIPIIDIINLGEYGVLNSDDFYFIRNADRTEFSIIKHTKTLKGRNDKYVDIRGRQKRNSTNRGNNSENGPVGIEGKNNPSNRNNRPSSNKSTFRENANKTQLVEETNGRTGVGNSSSDFGRGINSASKNQYSIPTEADELFDRYESGEISREEFMSEVDELYTQSVNDFGHLRKGERPKNAIKVPQRVEKDKKTHRFVRTIIESGVLTDEMLEETKTDILLGNFSYKAISDEAAKKKADQYIKEGKAKSIWEDAVNGSPVHISKETKKAMSKLIAFNFTQLPYRPYEQWQ